MRRYDQPEEIVTDRLPSYQAALTELGASDLQSTGRWLNNRGENSHLPLRRRERAMLRFRPRIRESDRDRALVNVQTDKDIWFHYRFLSSLLISSAYELPRQPGQRGNGHPIYLFVGSRGGGKSAAIACTLIETAKLNGVNPQAWLTHAPGRIADHKITRLDELMPWSYAAVAA